MLCPHLMPGIEKWNAHTAFWVIGISQHAFGFITQTAREPQILLDALTAFGSGDDVFQCQRNSANNFLGQAIATAVARLLGDAPP